MKKYIEVQEIEVPTGKEYDISSYPGLGMYLMKSGVFTLVYKHAATVSSSVLQLGELGIPIKEGDLDKEAYIPIIRDDHRVGVNDLLKAIAISQNPDLARELIK
jgi:hypothetical protein